MRKTNFPREAILALWAQIGTSCSPPPHFKTLFAVLALAFSAGLVRGQAPVGSGSQATRKYALLDNEGNNITDSLIQQGMRRKNSLTAVTCQAGRFDLTFTDNPGLGFNNRTNGQALRDVVCNVFGDLSTILPQNGRARIQIVGTVNLGSNVSRAENIRLYLDNPSGGFLGEGELVDNVLMRTLQAPRDYYETLKGDIFSELVNGQVAHGILKISMTGSNLPNTWHTGSGLPSATSSQKDLYSVVLREALAMLGIEKLIGNDFEATGGPNRVYSRYDSHLEVQYANGTTARLLTKLSGVWGPNPSAVAAMNNIIGRTCGTTNKIYYNMDGVSREVFNAPNFTSNGKELVTFGCVTSPCPTTGTPLRPCVSNGPAPRTPSLEDIKTLCNLGYSLATNSSGLVEYGAVSIFSANMTYSNPCGACSGRIVAMDDLEYDGVNQLNRNVVQKLDNSWEINPLANDRPFPTGLQINLSDVALYPSTAGIIVRNGNVINFEPAPNASGWAVIGYTPIAASQPCPNQTVIGNRAFVYINLESGLHDVPVANPNCDNSIAYGNFEAIRSQEQLERTFNLAYQTEDGTYCMYGGGNGTRLSGNLLPQSPGTCSLNVRTTSNGTPNMVVQEFTGYNLNDCSSSASQGNNKMVELFTGNGAGSAVGTSSIWLPFNSPLKYGETAIVRLKVAKHNSFANTPLKVRATLGIGEFLPLQTACPVADDYLPPFFVSFESPLVNQTFAGVNNIQFQVIEIAISNTLNTPLPGNPSGHFDFTKFALSASLQGGVDNFGAVIIDCIEVIRTKPTINIIPPAPRFVSNQSQPIVSLTFQICPSSSGGAISTVGNTEVEAILPPEWGLFGASDFGFSGLSTVPSTSIANTDFSPCVTRTIRINTRSNVWPYPPLSNINLRVSNSVNTYFCQGTSTPAVVNIIEPRIPSSNIESICFGEALELLTVGNPGDAYEWTGPNGFSSTLPNPVIPNFNPENLGYYTLTVNTLDGQQIVNTLFLTPTNCMTIDCEFGTFKPDYVFARDQTNIQSFYDLQNNNSFQGKTLYFPGGISNGRGTLQGVNYVFGVDARMEISTGSAMIIQNSTLKGCNDLWEGIVMEGGWWPSVASLTLNASTIEDAEIGISASSINTLNISNSTFHANRVGLRYTGDLGGNSNPVLKNNRFNCTNDVLLGEPSGGISSCGILLINVPTFSIPPGSQNFFEDMNSGIVGRNSGMKSFAQRFSNLRGRATNSVLSLDESGCGIFMSGDNSILRTLDHQGGTFVRCDKGISTMSARPIIRNTTMSEVHTGIRTTGLVNFWTNMNLAENNITANYYGIFAASMGTAAHIVNKNRIFMPNANNVGIYLADMGDVAVTNNAVEITDSEYGIHLRNVALPKLQRNGVIMMASGNPDLRMNMKAGIRLEACADGAANNNSVATRGTVPGYQALTSGGLSPTTAPPSVVQAEYPIGIELVATSNTQFECDYTEGTRTGLRMHDQCLNSAFSNSSMNTHRWGINYSNTAAPGNPLRGRDNGLQWNNMRLTGAVSKMPLGNTTLRNPLFVPTLPTNANRWPNSIYIGPNGNSALQVSSFNQNWITQTGNLTIPCTNAPIRIGKSANKSVASGDWSVEEYPVTSLWEEERKLYAILAEDDSLRMSDTLYTNFWNNKQASSIALYQEVETLTEGVEPMLTPTDAATLEALELAYETLMTELSQVDSAFASDGMSSTDKEYWTLRADSLRQQVTMLDQTREGIVSSMKALAINNANLVLTENGALPSQEIFEENAKTYNEIYLSTVAKGNYELDEYQQNAMYSIAMQCPLAGGEAVYKARAVVSLFAPEVKYEDHAACVEVGIQMRNTQEKPAEAFVFQIQPNPASDWAYMTWTATKGTGVIVITDALGKQVGESQKVNLESGFMDLETAKLQPGIYFFELRVDGKSTIAQKLVVLRM